MFSLLAWLRASAFSFVVLTSFARAREDSIFTSSVTYCNPPETLLISRFEVEYFAQNQSVSFNVSAASVQSNVSVVANLFLNVYGIKPVNVTLDLCTILGGALCPLPMYNFTGADSITLPQSLNVASKIPAIGFKIPDLEGFAQLTLTEADTGVIKACVQATLANGWSTHQKAVEWTMGGIAITALLASLGVSILAADAIAPFRFLELMFLYQYIASSALLNLNYPSVYRSFALNFAWAIGLFPTSDSSTIQSSINSLRHRTGGQLSDGAAGSAVQFVNRKSSPYNDIVAASTAFSAPLGNYAKRELSSLVERFSSIPSIFPFLGNDAANLAKRQTQTIQGEVQTVTADSSNILQAGLPIYVNSANVATANAFMTVFLCALMLFAVGIAMLVSGYGIYLLYNRTTAWKQNRTFDYMAYAKSWIIRLSLISSAPLFIFIFYQWTLKDSWASILFSVFSLVALVGLIGWPTYFTYTFARRQGVRELYSSGERHFITHAPLFAQYRMPRYYFFAITLAATIIRSIFIAFAKSSPTAQIALLVALEGLVVISYVVLKPYPTRGGDVFGTYLAIVRFVCAGLMVGFLQSLNVSPIPRVVIGIIIALIFSVAIITTVINFFLNLFTPGLFNGKQLNRSHGSGSDGSILEKGEKVLIAEGSGSGSENAQDRPENPTPEHSTSPDLDTSILQPFPISPTGTTVTTMDPPSIYSRDSGTTTIGSLLPRRWSFSWSQPNSPAGSSAHGHSGREEAFQYSPSSGNTPEGYLSRRTSDSMGLAPSSSPSAWRPPLSNGGSSQGHLTRSSSTKVLQTYQQNHDPIAEHPVS